MNNDRKLISRSFVEQHDMTDCGAACLLMLVRYYGGDSSIMHLRELSGTSNTGTTLLGLCQAARTMGFNSDGVKIDDIDELRIHNHPCILAVVAEQIFTHYLVCYGYKNGKYIIGDPAKGIVEMKNEELCKIFTFNCLTLEPNKQFEYKESISKKKKSWIIGLVHEDYGLLFSSLVIGIITTMMGMAMTLFSQKLIDDILPAKDTLKLIVGLCAVLCLTIFSVLLSALRSKLLITQRKDFNNRIIRFFFNKMLRMPKSYFDTRKIGDMLSRLGDTGRIQSIIVSLTGNTIISVLVVLIYTAFLFYFSWKIALIAILCSPVFFWIIASTNKNIIRGQKEVMSSSAISQSAFINTIEGIAEIKSFSRQDIFLGNNCNVYANLQDKIFALGRIQIGIGINAGLFSTIVQTGLIAICSAFVLKDDMTIGVLMAVITISSTIFSNVSGLAMIMIPINEAKVAFERMFEFVDSPEDNNTNDSDGQEDNKKFDAEVLSVKNLSFRFIGRKLLLNNLSFLLRKGTITGIVGESGCGKSTLCQLLERFYEPESGSICLDGTDVKDVCMKEWCSMVSFVPQDVFLYNGTVLDNICFGQTPEKLKDVFDFCDKYGFSSYFNELPSGLMTLVGEEGINLSGGQKQLVAFARALYNPCKILILDEMTAAMDRRTEKYICNLLLGLKNDMIILFVTHRLETARMICDRIIVMENGTIQAEGSHSELILTDNFYGDYWNSLNDQDNLA